MIGKPNDPVGAKEIAEELGCARSLIHSYQQRGILPKPRWTVSGQPAWRRGDVLKSLAARGYPRPDPRNRSVMLPGEAAVAALAATPAVLPAGCADPECSYAHIGWHTHPLQP